MAHLALYREFRPQRFADVRGQQHITRTIKNALLHNRMHHAYLLSGPRGTGKTTVARLIAKAVNCLNRQDGEPCNECTACRSVMSGETMDVIEIDAASNRGIDEIRDLREKVKYAPADLTYKVYIIDEVHMLSEPAFNALLKTLEEPPSHVMFVLATTEKQKLPVTIVSRCQCFEYHRLSAQEIVNRLHEVVQKYGVQATDEALAAIARQAEGGMRDALSLLDQVMAFAVSNEITLEDTLHVLGSAPLDQFLRLDSCMIQADVGSVLMQLDELFRQGKDMRQLVRDFLAHMRDLLLLKVDTAGSVLDLPTQSLDALKQVAAKMDQAHLLAGIRLFAQLENDMRHSTSPRLLVEVGFIRLTGVFSGTAAAEPAPAPAPALAAPAARKQAVREDTQPDRPGSSEPAESVKIEPSKGPAAPQGPFGEGVERVVQVWDEVLDLVKKARPSTHMLLTQARVGRLRGQTILLVAPNPTFADLLKRPADKSIIEKAIAKVGLGDLEVHPVGPDDPAIQMDAEAGRGAAGKAGDERSLLDAARSVFPQELVHEVTEEGS